MFFAVLRLIFGLKTKIAPPKRNWGESGRRSWGEFWRRPLFFFVFFGDHLILDRKTSQSDLRLMIIWVKLVQYCFKLQKSPPPLCEILVTRLRADYNTCATGKIVSRGLRIYSPSFLSQKRAKKPFELRNKLPPAHLSTTHGGGFALSLSMLNVKLKSCEYQFL